MLELKNDSLEFHFPEIHPEAKCWISFQRTLRIPDDGRSYPLPPGLGNFPMRHVDDFKKNVPDEWLKRGGVMLPLYQSEALWVNFRSNFVHDHGHEYPFAVKVSAGKRSAVTGKAWSKSLREDDYVVLPTQPWIDGYVVEKGKIRQFVAVPLGAGFSVEEQLTGKAEFGGIQLEVYPMKRANFERRWPKRARPRLGLRAMSASFNDSDDSLEICEAAAMPCASASMGIGAGGTMEQEIYEDPYGLNEWDLDTKNRCFVHLANSLVWRTITNEEPPATPATASLYKRYNYPWFEYYDDSTAALGATEKLKGIKSVAQLSKEKGIPMLPENSSVKIDQTVKLKTSKVRDGKWT